MSNSNLHKKIIAYLKGDLNSDESQKIEESMAVSEFENDALDGLTQLKEPEKLEKIINDLDHHLRTEIHKKNKKKINLNDHLLIAIISLITILLTVFMAYYIYRLMT